MIDYRRKTVIKGQQELRCGYTTVCGSCCQSRRGYFVERRNLQDVSCSFRRRAYYSETEFLECSEKLREVRNDKMPEMTRILRMDCSYAQLLRKQKEKPFS